MSQIDKKNQTQNYPTKRLQQFFSGIKEKMSKGSFYFDDLIKGINDVDLNDEEITPKKQVNQDRTTIKKIRRQVQERSDKSNQISIENKTSLKTIQNSKKPKQVACPKGRSKVQSQVKIQQKPQEINTTNSQKDQKRKCNFSLTDLPNTFVYIEKFVIGVIGVISKKQWESKMQITERFSQIKIEFQSNKIVQSLQDNDNSQNLSGQDLQRDSKTQNSASINHNKNANKVQDVKSYVKSLKTQFNQKAFNKKTIESFVYHLSEIYANNFYLCTQQSFEKIKEIYEAHRKIKNQSFKAPGSIRKSQNDSGAEFNLELTMKSKQSKNSMTMDRQDSLIYSNATSFGLQNTQNRSKQVQRINSSTKLLKSNDDNQFQIQIDNTSSKGQIENEQRQFSSKQYSDNEKAVKYPPKMSYDRNRNSSSSRKSNSLSREGSRIPQNKSKDIENSEEKKSPIHEQQEYQIIPLTKAVKSPGDNQKDEDWPKIVGPSEKQIKKSFSIKSHGKKSESKHQTKKAQQSSVFSSQIANLQGRISRIKQAKLLKKKKLQEQLKKINDEIEDLKLQEQKQQRQVINHSPLSTHAYPNTIQSRIKINDNIQQKQKAIKLVNNLKAEKISRQNQRRNITKTFDEDLNEKMEEIMKLKYFNEERIKQKKKLQIIERMKQQEIRKIQQQRQKQQSIEFLSKLRHQQSHKENHIKKNQSSRVSANNVSKVHESPVKKPYQSPVRRTEPKQPATTNPALQKKKAYLNKMRNFTIIKKSKQDLYEQLLN